MTDDQIRQGLQAHPDPQYQDINWLFHDPKLKRMAEMLVDCDWDRTLMKVKYADELDTLEHGPRVIVVNWISTWKIQEKSA